MGNSNLPLPADFTVEISYDPAMVTGLPFYYGILGNPYTLLVDQIPDYITMVQGLFDIYLLDQDVGGEYNDFFDYERVLQDLEDGISGVLCSNYYVNEEEEGSGRGSSLSRETCSCRKEPTERGRREKNVRTDPSRVLGC